MDNPNKRGITAGNIFYYHQIGVRYKGKMKIRQTMPVVWDNVPKDIYERFVARIVRVMNGR
jgi:glutathionyl-hydroquinone reductase